MPRRTETDPSINRAEISISDDDLTIDRSPLVIDEDEPEDDDGLTIEIGTVEWRPSSARGASTQAALMARIDGELSEQSGPARVTELLDRGEAESQAGREDAAVVALDMAMTAAAGCEPAEAEVASRERTIARIFDGYLDRVRGSSACALPTAELLALDLDPESAFLLSRADGHLTVDDIIDVSGMPRIEASRHLCRLVMTGLLLARPH